MGTNEKEKKKHNLKRCRLWRCQGRGDGPCRCLDDVQQHQGKYNNVKMCREDKRKGETRDGLGQSKGRVEVVEAEEGEEHSGWGQRRERNVVVRGEGNMKGEEGKREKRSKHGKKTRIRGYPSESVPTLTGNTRVNRVWVFSDNQKSGTGTGMRLLDPSRPRTRTRPAT